MGTKGVRLTGADRPFSKTFRILKRARYCGPVRRARLVGNVQIDGMSPAARGLRNIAYPDKGWTHARLADQEGGNLP